MLPAEPSVFGFGGFFASLAARSSAAHFSLIALFGRERSCDPDPTMSVTLPYDVRMITPDHDKALSYHPLTPGRGEVHEELRSFAKGFAGTIDTLCPPSREASLAFTALQEALMWANAAVAIHDEAEPAEQ